MLLREAVGVEIGGLHHCLETQAFGAAQCLQPPLKQVARVAGLHRDVSHNPQRHQIEVLGNVLRSTCPVVQRLRQFVGASDARQLAQRMLVRQHLGVHDRVGFGQDGGQIVVIGNDHIHTVRLSIGDRLMGGDAGVARQQQVHAIRDEPLQHRQVDAVRLRLADWNVVPNGCPQISQRGDQERRRRLSVYIEVAPDTDHLSLSDGTLQSLSRFRQVWEIGRRGGPVAIRIEKGPRRLHIGEASSHQSPRHQRMPADSSLEPFGHFNLWWLDPLTHQYSISAICSKSRETSKPSPNSSSSSISSYAPAPIPRWHSDR